MCSGHPAPARAVLLLQLLGKAVSSTTSGGFPRRSRGGECHDYPSNINSLSSTPELIRGDPSAQALPDKCKICMMHGLCIFFFCICIFFCLKTFASFFSLQKTVIFAMAGCTALFPFPLSQDVAVGRLPKVF